jgi:biotin carboxyl carrier protein
LEENRAERGLAIVKYIALVKGEEIPVEITREGKSYRLTIKDKSFTVDAFQPRTQTLSLLIEGKSYEAGLVRNENRFTVYLYNDTIELELLDARRYRAVDEVRAFSVSGPLKIQAPMPGKIVKVAVKEQAVVEEGDSLLTMEAMKMQNELKAPRSGTVSRIEVREGEAVSMSQVLVILE